MARAGLASRREAEAWVAAGRVSVNGKVVATPALNVSGARPHCRRRQPAAAPERTRLFRYHKPRGLVTTHTRPGRAADGFRRAAAGPAAADRIGRLDINTEGLLLLTNDGGLARVLELPATGWLRRYRVRAYGRVTQETLDGLKKGVTIDGVHYGPIEATLERQLEANAWLDVGIREGKNREIRRVMESLGLKVSRLIRIGYGPFELGDVEEGAAEEVPTAELKNALGPELIKQAGADFDAPLHVAEDSVSRHSGAGRRPEPGMQKQMRSKRLDSGSPLRGVRNDGEKSLRGHPPLQGRDKRKGKARRPDRSGGPRPSRPRPK